MASIFDTDDTPPVYIKEPVKRSKTREVEPMTGYEVIQGKRRLADLVEKAFQTLEDAAEKADFATAVKAATAILDRAGFGPKSTIDATITTVDLSNLSREELAERAKRVHQMLLEKQRQEPLTIEGQVVKVERVM